MMSRPFSLNRRAFLNGIGATLSLPALECMGAAAITTPPKRFLGVHVALGLHPDSFYPKTVGANYELSPLLKPLAAHRDKLSIFKGLSHPKVSGGHRGIVTWLTGVDVFGFSGYDFKNTISLDQLYANHVGSETRFSSLQIAASGNRSASSWDVAWSEDGIALQPMSRPREVFQKLFVASKATNTTAREREFARRTSLLDRVMDQATSLDRKLGKADQEKMDEYLTAVREVERRIEKAEAWANEPKPKVAMTEPTFNSNKDDEMFENMAIMYRLIALAFETDSTRSIVFQIPANNTVFKSIDGVTQGYHGLSHHGKEKEKIAQLVKIETEHTRQLGKFLDRIDPMLDDTTVLFGSGMGNAASHSNRDLPTLVAGGGYKTHGQFRNYARQSAPPLSNLYVSMLQQLGMETDQFGTSTGTFNDLA